jgi:hypothetical protein
VKSFLRILIVWLALLAVPFAGFASAAAACRAPTVTHHHDAGACAQHHHDTQDHGSKHDAKCANCAACCTAAVLAPLAFAQPPLMPPASSHAIAFDAGHMPTVDPDHPERPPRFQRA